MLPKNTRAHLPQSDTRLLGFDPAPPNDVLRGAMRLLGLLKDESEDEDMRDEWEGAAVFSVDGQIEVWLFWVNPEDGYRSSLAPIALLTADIHQSCILQFANDPRPVRVREADREDWYGIEVVDAEGDHIWLHAGTDNSDQYYPVGQVGWYPK